MLYNFDGKLMRKVEFPVRGHRGYSAETMWCEVESEKSTVGILRNDSIFYEHLTDGTPVSFEIGDDGLATALRV